MSGDCSWVKYSLLTRLVFVGRVRQRGGQSRSGPLSCPGKRERSLFCRASRGRCGSPEGYEDMCGGREEGTYAQPFGTFSPEAEALKTETNAGGAVALGIHLLVTFLSKGVRRGSGSG